MISANPVATNANRISAIKLSDSSIEDVYLDWRDRHPDVGEVFEKTGSRSHVALDGRHVVHERGRSTIQETLG